MDQKLFKVEKYTVRAATALRKWQAWFPLALAGVTLLAGLLPIAGVPWLKLHLNVYGITSRLALLQFLLFPLALGATWLLEKFANNFDRYAKSVYAIAAAVQVVSVFFLSSVAGRQLAAQLLATQSRPELLPQRLGVGFYFLLVPTVVFLLYSGLRVLLAPVQRKARKKFDVGATQDVVNHGQNPFDFSR
ncbi:MAG: hypothetical protein LBB50_02655 [Oscillospiraceae bacterium]|jgi:hypothetical protein|nr:hypothetical protein [Oscillospiraceae bacterium]